MRIAIDMQGAQTESRFRGIGRYTMSLALAMVRNRGMHDIVLVLNGMFTETIEPIRAAFNEILPQSSVHVWYGPQSARAPGNESTWEREAAASIREAFIVSLRPDVLHITSLFEGYADDAITSIRDSRQSIPTAVTLYDLIPLLNADTYLKPSLPYAQYYLRRIDFLKRADAWLAISESTLKEGIEALQLPAHALVNISAACDAVFSPQTVQEDHQRRLFDSLGIARPFVLYSGGADVRKNLPRLIRAYANLPMSLRDRHQLVLVGKMPAGQVAELHQAARAADLGAQEMLLTGYISDADLAVLYSLCAVFAISGTFVTLLIVSVLSTLIVYAVCCLATIQLKRKNIQDEGAIPFNVPGGPVIPILATAMVVWLMSSSTQQEFTAMAVMVVGLTLLFFLMRILSKPAPTIS